jgi:arylsulfatase A-like enzyme
MADAVPPQWANLLVLIAYDLTYIRVCAMGNLDVETPHLDALIWRGCTFSNCFHQGSWSATVCVASRSMLNSGLTAFRARLR